MHTNRLILLIILILLGLGAFVFLAGVLSGPVTRLTGTLFNATGIGYRSGDVPGQVVNLTGVAGDGQVTLIWSPPRGGESLVRYYKVYRGTDAEEVRFHAQVADTAFSDTGLRNGMAYYYRVSAVSDAGEGVLSGIVGSSASQVRVAPIVLSRGEGSLSNEVRLIPRGAVSRVTVESSTVSRQTVILPRIYLLAGVPGDGYISLAWSLSPVGGVPVSYRLYRRMSWGGEQLLRTLSESVYIDRDVTNGFSYTYRVVATNSAGESPSSNEVTLVPNGVVQPPQAAILTVPSPVMNLTATPGNGQAYLLWSEPYRGSTPIVFYRVYRGYSYGNESAIATTSIPSWTDSAVANGTTYYYRVAAVNSYGESSSSNRVAATPQGYVYTPISVPAPVYTPAPVSVTNLTATAGEQSVSLLWTTPSGVAGPVSYRIYREVQGGGFGFYASTTSPWYTDGVVSSGVTYRYYITVVSGAGEGAPSNTVVATSFTSAQPIGQVTNLTANPTNPTDGRTVLSWSPASGAAGYRVYRSGGGFSETLLTSTSGTSYTDTGLATGQSYIYRVRAYNGSGEGAFSNYAYVTTEQNIPGTVTDLRVESSGDGFVQLVWSRPSGPLFVSTFRILRGTVPGGETPVSTLYGLRYLDSSVRNGVTYYYRVQAINPGSGPDGLRSNPVSATPTAPIVIPPGPVTDLTANPTNPTDGRTVLTWSPVSGNAVKYRVYRSRDGSSETLRSSTSGTSYTDTGLAEGRSYAYRVRAYTSSDEGAFSNHAFVTPFALQPSLPGPVANLTANPTNPTDGRTTLTWSPVSGSISGYRIYRSGGGSSETLLTSTFGTSYTDTGLATGQSYTYRVRAYNGSGEGAFSNYASATLLVSPSLPGQVTNLTANPTNPTDGRTTLTWSPVSGSISGYRVYRSQGSGPEGNPTSTAFTSYTDAYLVSGNSYTYRVVAYNSLGKEGASSNRVTVTAGAPQVLAPGSVTNFVADGSQSGSGKITLRWNPVSGATTYTLYRNGAMFRVRDAGFATSFEDTEWNRWGAAYTYSIEAVNSAGSGPRAYASTVGYICGGISDGASCGSTVYLSGGQTSYACRASQCIGTWSPAPGSADTTGGRFFCRDGMTWIDRFWNSKSVEWYVNSSCS